MSTKRVNAELGAETHWSIGEFASQIGKSVATLKRWDRLGLLTAGRWPSGRRYYTETHLRQALGEPEGRVQEKNPVPPGGTPTTAPVATTE